MIYDTNKNALYTRSAIADIKKIIESIKNEKHYDVATVEITVTTSMWYDRYCSIGIADISKGSKVDVNPDATSKTEYDSCGVYCSAVGDGHIVLTAETTPQNDISVTVEYSKENKLTAGQINTRINGYILGSMRYYLQSALPSGEYGSGYKTGLPYSSVSAENTFIGINLSLYTFLSVVANPLSMLYTTASKSWNGYAYYGTVCTSLVCAAWKLPIIINTYCFEKGNHITKLGTANNITDFRVGDMLLYNKHASLIVDVKDDLSRIVVAESKWWNTTINVYNSLSAFRSAWGNNQVCRYDDIDNVGYLMDECYIDPSHYNHDEIDFPDIMTNYGDKCLLLPTDSVILDVLDDTGYTGITLYKDGAVVDTYQLAQTITLGNLTAGDYKAVMTGENKESICYWTVADVSASLEGNIISFESSNCVPVWVTGHPEQVKDQTGKYTEFHGMAQESQITDEERACGFKNISDLLADSDSQGMVQVHFKHRFGVVPVSIIRTDT